MGNTKGGAHVRVVIGENEEAGGGALGTPGRLRSTCRTGRSTRQRRRERVQRVRERESIVAADGPCSGATLLSDGWAGASDESREEAYATARIQSCQRRRRSGVCSHRPDRRRSRSEVTRKTFFKRVARSGVPRFHVLWTLTERAQHKHKISRSLSCCLTCIIK